MNITASENSKITFTTIKAGRADLKKDGGTVRGRHLVEVEMTVGVDHKTIAALDLARLESVERHALKSALKGKGLSFTDQDFDDALEGHTPRKKGLITSLRQSAQGVNPDNKHLKAYSPHSSGLKGISVHDETGAIHIKGIVVSETQLAQDPNGDARLTNSGIHVLLKSAISKELGLISRKWRQYKLPSNAIINKA